MTIAADNAISLSRKDSSVSVALFHMLSAPRAVPEYSTPLSLAGGCRAGPLAVKSRTAGKQSGGWAARLWRNLRRRGAKLDPTMQPHSGEHYGQSQEHVRRERLVAQTPPNEQCNRWVNVGVCRRKSRRDALHQKAVRGKRDQRAEHDQIAPCPPDTRRCRRYPRLAERSTDAECDHPSGQHLRSEA